MDVGEDTYPALPGSAEGPPSLKRRTSRSSFTTPSSAKKGETQEVVQHIGATQVYSAAIFAIFLSTTYSTTPSENNIPQPQPAQWFCTAFIFWLDLQAQSGIVFHVGEAELTPKSMSIRIARSIAKCKADKVPCSFRAAESNSRNKLYYCSSAKVPENSKIISSYKLAALEKKAAELDRLQGSLKLDKITKSQRIWRTLKADGALAEIASLLQISHSRLPHVILLSVMFFGEVLFANADEAARLALAHLFSAATISKIVPNPDGVRAAISAIHNVEILTMTEQLAKSKTVSISCDAGTGKDGTFVPFVASSLQEDLDKNIYVAVTVLDTAEIPKGGENCANSLLMVLQAFGILKILYSICTDGAPDMVFMHGYLMAIIPTLVCITCTLHSLNLVLAGAWSKSFGDGKDWNAASAARMIFLIPYMMDHYEVQLCLFEAEHGVRFVRTKASWGRWWSVTVACGMVVGNRDLLLLFLVKMGAEDRSPTFAPIAKQAATWLANDVLWCQLCFLQGFCRSWWDVHFLWLQRFPQWMSSLPSDLLQGGFRAGELPRYACAMRASLLACKDMVDEEKDPDRYFELYRMALAQLTEQQRQQQLMQVGVFFKLACGLFDKHFGRWNGDLADCALADPDINIAFWTMKTILHLFDEESVSLGTDEEDVPAGLVFTELVDDPTCPAVVKEMTKGLTNGEKRKRLSKKSALFTNAAAVAAIRGWVEGGGKEEELLVEPMFSFVQMVRGIRVQSQNTEHNVGAFKFVMGGSNRGTMFGLLAGKHMNRENHLLVERRGAIEERKEDEAFKKSVAEKAANREKGEESREPRPDARNKAMLKLAAEKFDNRANRTEETKKRAMEHKKSLEERSLDGKSRELRNRQAMINDTKKSGTIDLAKELDKIMAKGKKLEVSLPAMGAGFLNLAFFLAESRGKLKATRLASRGKGGSL